MPETIESVIEESLKHSVNTFVYGLFGVGKTFLIKRVLKNLNSSAYAIYVDCSLYSTTNAILREILASLGGLAVSKSNYDLMKRLAEKIRREKPAVCLDHFQHLKDPELLDLLDGAGLTVLIVSDGADALRMLSVAQRSRFLNIIEIQSKSNDEIKDTEV